MWGIVENWFDENKNELQICAYLGHKQTFQVRTTASESLNLSLILSTLERAAVDHNFKIIQWPNDDEIFDFVKYEDFIEHCDEILKRIEIAMITPAKTVTEKHEKDKLLQTYHDDHIRGGHCGQKRMYSRLRAQYFWKNMLRDIANYVNKCEKCMLNKPRVATREPMKITPTPQKPFDVVEIDTIGPFQKSFCKNEYAITLICDLTK